MARVPEVLVVDQDPQNRFEIKRLVKQGQLAVAGDAAFGTEAVSLAAEVKPDVIMCGMSDPPGRSLQTIEAMLDVLPETPIIAYGWGVDMESMRQAMLTGTRDFLLMPVEADRFLDSVRSVLQSEERKRLRLSGQAQALGPRGMVVAVFSAKGGVGKTTLATNLGVALSTAVGQSVVLVDADASFGDVAAMLDMKPDRSLVDLLRDVERVERNTVTDYLARHDSGLWVLAAPRETLQWRSVSPERFRRVIGLLAKRFDVVLIDSTGALTELALAVLEESNLVLWVTSSDFSSINNSLQGLETLRALSYPEGKVRLMLNVTSAEDGVRPAKIETALGRQFFWLIPYDRLLRLGAQVGRPAVITSPESRGCESIVELAHALMGVVPKPKPKNGLIRSLLPRRDGPRGPVGALEGRS